MDGEKKKKQQIARRKPGLSIEPPKPRPMESDHFALQLFRANTEDKQLEPASTATSIPPSIPPSTPTAIATSTTTSLPASTGTSNAPSIPATFEPIEYAQQPSSRGASIPPSTQRVSYYLDATHTGAEQRVYSVMYRETISKGAAERHFSVRELLRKTGILAENTVRRALRGLINKQSIEMLSFDMGDNYGPLYRVFAPKEIEERRNRAGIVIEMKSKRILQPSSLGASRPPSLPPSIRPSDTPSTPAPIPAPSVEGEPPSKNEAMIIHGNNTYGPQSASSGPTGNDDEKIAKVRKLFEQLSNGGQWRDDRDLKAYEQIAHIGIFHIILGLCASISKSPEHRMSSLAYAVPAIVQHAEYMDEFPAEQLIEIAYKTKRTTILCIQSGRWTVPEWQSGD